MASIGDAGVCGHYVVDPWAKVIWMFQSVSNLCVCGNYVQDCFQTGGPFWDSKLDPLHCGT